MSIEISTIILNNFLYNQDSGNISGSGSLGVERINSFVNFNHFHVGMKGIPKGVKRILKIWFAFNIKKCIFLVKNKLKWPEAMSVEKWKQCESLIRNHGILCFKDKDCLMIKKLLMTVLTIKKVCILQSMLLSSNIPSLIPTFLQFVIEHEQDFQDKSVLCFFL